MQQIDPGKGLCFQEPCDASLKGWPGCEPCPPGKVRNSSCACEYPAGTEHSCDVGWQGVDTQWSHHSESGELGACRAEGEREARKRCTARSGLEDWAEVVVNTWRNGANQVEEDVTRCTDLLQRQDFCHGAACPRPCPSGQCIHDGACVTPRGGPIDGLCGGVVFCRLCR
jgi:hypothetical protein